MILDQLRERNVDHLNDGDEEHCEERVDGVVEKDVEEVEEALFEGVDSHKPDQKNRQKAEGKIHQETAETQKESSGSTGVHELLVEMGVLDDSEEFVSEGIFLPPIEGLQEVVGNLQHLNEVNDEVYEEEEPHLDEEIKRQVESLFSSPKAGNIPFARISLLF